MECIFKKKCDELFQKHLYKQPFRHNIIKTMGTISHDSYMTLRA